MRRQFWVTAAGLLLALYGCAVMVGWLLRIPFWNAISPTGTLMVFQAALCFALTGIGLCARQMLPTQTPRIRLVLGSVVAVIALLMILETVFSMNFGVDLAEIHRWYLDKNPYPGRMAPNAAIGFLLAGITLIQGAASKKNNPMFMALPAAIVTLGVIGLLGYTLIFDLAYGWFNDVRRMALPAAVGMIVLGLSLMLDREDMPKLISHRAAAERVTAADDARVYAFFGVAITILLMVSFVSYGSIKALVDRANLVEHTSEVLGEFEALLTQDSRANNAWRSFIVTHERDRFDEMHAAGKAISLHMLHLQQLTVDNPAQQQRLATMQQLIDTNSTLLNLGPATQANAYPESPVGRMRQQAELSSNRRKFSSLAADFQTEENRLMVKRQSESRMSVKSTINIIIIGNLVALAIMFYAAWILKRQNNQRDQLTNAMERTNNFLDSLIEHIPNMVHVKDAKTLRTVRLNKAGEQMMSTSRTEIIGKNSHDFFPASEADLVDATDKAALAGKGAYEIPQQSLRTKNHGVRILHTWKIPIVDDDGRALYLLGISEDITERKKAEEVIATLNEDLKKRAIELETTNGELESFSYSVSHDLRAPLRAINGYALMLEEDYRDRIDDAGNRYIKQIRGYSNQMGTLIDDLLRLSRLGRQAMKSVEIEMKGLVQGVVQAELGAWHATGEAPRIEIADLPAAKADPVLLRQVWANLIANALKYSGKKTAPLIRIRGYVAGDEVVYSVQDNGAGFDMAYYDKLFSVFQRLHRADEFPGTGVGLAIVQRVVTRHGGKVWAEGKVNHGAEFFFSLSTKGNDSVIGEA